MNQRSWRTTTCGILIIVGCIIHGAVQVLQGQTPNLLEVFACVTTGVGLIHASDHKVVTGGTQ